jgi:hypothetical protein
MVSQVVYDGLVQAHPGLEVLDAKVTEVARGELDAGESVERADAVTVGGIAGCAVLTDRRVVVFWKMKMLFFFSFPTVQEFALTQLVKVDGSGAALMLRAESDPGSEDGDWEANTLVFKSESARASFEGMLPSA